MKNFTQKKASYSLRLVPNTSRPAEVHKLCGDCSLAEKELGWVRKVDFSGLVSKMYHNDYSLLSK